MNEPQSPEKGKGHFIIIAEVGRESSDTIRIQDFQRGQISFIPVFTSEAMFKSLTGGSGFEEKGISIDMDLFFSMLRGDETLILNPGSDHPWIIKADDQRMG